MSALRRHREDVILSALSLFRQQGFVATGVADILASSGAPRGSLYHYFPGGKDEVAEVAIRLAGINDTKLLQQEAATARDAVHLVRRFVQLQIERVLASNFIDGCPIAAVMGDTVVRSARLREAGAAAYLEWMEILAAKLREGGVQSERSAALGVFAVAAVQGALLLSRMCRDIKPLTDTQTELQNAFAHALAPAGVLPQRPR